jgi:hypothetical protein
MLYVNSTVTLNVPLVADGEPEIVVLYPSGERVVLEGAYNDGVITASISGVNQAGLFQYQGRIAVSGGYYYADIRQFSVMDPVQ